MNDALIALGETLTALPEVLEAFIALRDACSDQDWEDLNSAAPMERLLDALTELEDAAK